MKLSLKSLGTLVVVAAALSGAGKANAQLLGQMVNGTYFFPNSSNVYSNQGNKLVNPSASFTFPTGIPNVTATVTNSNILTTFDNNGTYTGAAFNGFKITDVSSDPMLTGVSAVSSIAGFSASRVSFTSNSVSVNLQGLTVNRADTISIDLQTASAAVPEPSSLAFLGTSGMMGAGVFIRRKRQTKA
jgi:hypothetical protein